MMAAMIRQVESALTATFRGPRSIRAYVIFLGVGVLATAFELIALPSPAVGGLSFSALRFLTPWLAAAAAFIGFGFGLSLALNADVTVGRRTSRAAGVGGMLASVLPGSLCCTSIVPSLLAALGASAPTVLGTTGKIQAIFALHEDAFLAASLAGVALSLGLAISSRAATCRI